MSNRPASFTEADARRACRAAPDRVVEIHLPDGTVIRMLPGEAAPEVAKKREVRL
jgi:hypothetical protein